MPPSDAFKGKTILVVNTGSLKKKFILQKIKKLGITTVILNKEKNWAQQYADHWILADTFNHDECLAAVQSFIDTEAIIDGAITFWEDDVLLTSKIADQFGLIGIPFEVAKTCRNKRAFREFCRLHGLPTTEHVKLENDQDLDSALRALHFPVVLKPAFGSSSAFVVKADNPEELIASYHYVTDSLSGSIESSLADGSEIFVEDYIDGEEVDIDILIQNGRIKFHAISDNTKTKEPFFVETDRFTPSNLPVKDQEDLFRMADEVLEKLGVQNGCIHFEAKSTKKGPVPIEVNLRMGGDEIYSSIKEAYHIDLIENALKIALGIFLPKTDALPRKHLVSRTLSSDHSGILSNLDIPPDVLKMPFVEELEVHKKVGDTLFVPPEGYEYLGWMMVSGDNFLDAQDNLTSIQKKIHFEVSKFHKDSSIGMTSGSVTFPFARMGKNVVLQRKKIERMRRLGQKESLHIGIARNSIDENTGSHSKKILSEALKIAHLLKALGHKVTYFNFNKTPAVFDLLKKSDIDIMLNFCDQQTASITLNQNVAAILEVFQIPYTGSNPLTLALCQDKITFKKILAFHTIPTPSWDYVYDLDDPIDENLDYPLILKPSVSDNSLGISNDSVVNDKKELKERLAYLLKTYKMPILIEEYIDGDEYHVSILGNDDLRVFPLARTIFDDLPKGYWHIHPYESKWQKDPVYREKLKIQIPPKNISKKLKTLIEEIAIDTFNFLDCRDYGCVEIKVDKQNNPYVLELNANPFLSENSAFITSAKKSGLTLQETITHIIQEAIKRTRPDISGR